MKTKPKKLETVTVTMQEIWQQTMPKVHKSKKHYNRKAKHKKNPDRQNPDFLFITVKILTVFYNFQGLKPGFSPSPMLCPIRSHLYLRPLQRKLVRRRRPEFLFLIRVRFAPRSILCFPPVHRKLTQ